MATPRHKLIDDQVPLHYHLVSRCVRRAFLCGTDPKTGINYDHRREWLEERILQLAAYFAIAIDAYAIMSNHFHIVAYFDPNEAQSWSDQEVARRWMSAFPVRNKLGDIDHVATEERQTWIAEHPNVAKRRRAYLGSVSYFMKHLKQPIAYRANQEDGCTGHFFEQRFYSGALLDEEGLIAAMAYVDLNPVRAGIAASIESASHTSVRRRLMGFTNTARRLKRAVRPVVSGLREIPTVPALTLADYVELLNEMIRPRQESAEPSAWAARIASIGKFQRAYGSHVALSEWLSERCFRPLESPLP